MELLGHVDHGVIVPHGDGNLPEGAVVRIVYEPEVARPTKARGRQVMFPLVESNQPGSVRLTNDRIAEILDEDELAP